MTAQSHLRLVHYDSYESRMSVILDIDFGIGRIRLQSSSVPFSAVSISYYGRIQHSNVNLQAFLMLE